MSNKGEKTRQTLGERAFGKFTWPDGTIPPVLAGSPIPLAIGSGEQIKAMLPQSEKESFEQSLAIWVRGYPYLQAIIEGTWRHDIMGRPVEEISENNREQAQNKLALKAMRKAREQRETIQNALDDIDKMFSAPSKVTMDAAKKALKDIRRVIS